MRFLDNFSAGTRGATSAEYFLAAGYAVIFFHRLHSLRPFSRHYSHSLNPFLDLLTIENDQITVKPSDTQLLPILRAHHQTQESGSILSMDFQTVNEYLWLLRAITREMSPLGRRGMFYLAAAVSDFFLPDERVVSPSLSKTDDRRNTRYNPVWECSPWKWIKCQRCSDRWCRNGSPRDT